MQYSAEIVQDTQFSLAANNQGEKKNHLILLLYSIAFGDLSYKKITVLCLIFESLPATVPENDRLSLRTLYDPTVVGRTEAVRPAVISRAPYLSLVAL